MGNDPAIRTAGIDKSFGTTRAVIDATISVGQGELVALLGPSGSGKTTLLRVIAGFEVPDAGTVEVGGRAVVGPGVWEEPERRRIGMVFQDGALFPHLTVARNVAFGGPRPGRVEETLALVGLAHRSRSYPHELSGGERQRVALARALAMDPEVVLLDEPFVALDAGLREVLREQVAGILRKAGASALLVTHDQEEALSLADRIVLMCEGRVEQAGPPEEVYAHPATGWVAEFLGAAEVLPGTAAGGLVDCDLGRFPAGSDVEGQVEVVVRPEVLAVASADDGAANGAVPARVVGRTYYGHDQLVRLELASGRQVRSRTSGSVHWVPGDEVRVRVDGPVSVLRSHAVECTS
ncbi:MAG: ABC transporter ATP-binding protein [Acidimicrobiia bacterium]